MAKTAVCSAMAAAPVMARWMPVCAFVLGAGVVTVVWIAAGTALRPQPGAKAESWAVAPADFGFPEGESDSVIVARHFRGGRSISPGSMRGMIDSMRRSEIEIATQRLERERGERNIAPDFQPESGHLPINLQNTR
jgi:hypothetical protein